MSPIGSASDPRRVCVACGSDALRHEREREGFVILSCPGCRTRQARVREDELPSYDDHYADAEHYGGYHRLARQAHDQVPALYWYQPRMMAEAGPGAGRLHIDVGSGLGTFLAQTRMAGWRVLGIDASRLAAEAAVREFAVETHVGSLETAPVPPGSVSWISAFEVVEHMYAPRRFVGRVVELLAPGGLLTVSVPNGRSRQEMHTRDPIMTPPTHVNFFSRAGLRRLFEDAGLQRVYDYEKPVPWGEIPLPRPLRLAAMPFLLLDRLLGHAGNRLLWVGRKPGHLANLHG